MMAFGEVPERQGVARLFDRLEGICGTYDVSTGLSGLLGDGSSDTSVTTGDDDGLR